MPDKLRQFGIQSSSHVPAYVLRSILCLVFLSLVFCLHVNFQLQLVFHCMFQLVFKLFSLVGILKD
jgi:hypothetical protein